MEKEQELTAKPDLLPDEIAGEDAPITEERSRLKQKYYIPILIVGLVITLAVIFLVDKPSDFNEYIQSSGYAGVLMMAIIGSTSPIWPLPGSWAAFIAGGLGLNPILLGLVAGIGETIGELTAYMAGYGGQSALAKWKRYKQIEGWTARHGAITIFLLSAIPNFFIKLVVIAAGALRYPWWKFFLLCWGGKTIKDFCFALAGAGLFAAIIRLLN